MTPKLSIVIVDYNASTYLKACLRSICKYLTSIPYEIIIVDNASKENHLEEYAKINTKVRTFRSEKNLGFGGGNNLGASKARGEYLLLLNPDTYLIDDSAQRLVKFYENGDRFGAITCLIYQENGKDLQESFFGRFQSIFGLLSRHYNALNLDKNKAFQEADIVTGACLLIKKRLFDEVQGFDEKIFMYLEDDDLCKKISNLGYKNGVLTTASIVHLEGKSSTNKKKKEMYYKSQNYYWQKHHGFLAAVLMRMMRWPYKLYRTKIKPN